MISNPWKRSPKCNEKIFCEYRATRIRRSNSGRRKNGCSTGTIYCNQWLTFSTTYQADLSCFVDKKHSSSQPNVTHDCQDCNQNFPSFYSTRQHINPRKETELAQIFRALKLKLKNDKSFQDEILKCIFFCWFGKRKCKSQSFQLRNIPFSTNTVQ